MGRKTYQRPVCVYSLLALMQCCMSGRPKFLFSPSHPGLHKRPVLWGCTVSRKQRKSIEVCMYAVISVRLWNFKDGGS